MGNKPVKEAEQEQEGIYLKIVPPLEMKQEPEKILLEFKQEAEQKVKQKVKQEQEEILLKIVPPLDQAYVRWLVRDLKRVHGFTPTKTCAVTPPDHYIEYMRLNGWLDVDLDDPDLAHLFK
ncbi:hypothetical protein SLEP1_g43307 [Rubroshorea leprosula]|uniref:Uncharacterized protein n=1 Tax=Rubroshorea leprosula TaxID=152421 RepID=A0AAV5LCL6_9ROSI|nr:hypothetical protein SLEP1_g43307 [Rubroshorea leprosula]